MRSISFPGLFLGSLLLISETAQAQSTFASLTGNVVDASGAAVPNVKLEATKIETNFRYEAVSNNEGQYTLPNLPEGTYRLRASSQGFQDFQVDNIILTGRDVRRVDVSLTVGSLGTVVEVQGGATLIETETARIADTKDREVLRALPLTLRRAWDYFTMTPTVERTSSWHISIGGTRNNQSVAAIDGTPINDAGGGTGIGPLLDKTESVQELRIDMAQGSAEQMTPGQVTMISRAGSNDFHGAVSDYYSTDAFRARDPFQNTRANGRNHTVTASAGGPIWIPKIYDGRNRSFFFYTLEAGFGSKGVTNFVNGVPLEPWRRGDFSGEPGNIVDPFNNKAPFPNNRIPESRLNSTANQIQQMFYPLPNFGDPNTFSNSNFRTQRPAFRFWQPTTTIRVDQKINDRVFVYGRWTAVRWNIPNWETNMAPVTEPFARTRDMDAITGSYSHTISQSLISEFRYGFARQDFPQNPGISGNQVVQQLGLQGLVPNLPDVGGVHRVTFAGLGLTPLQVQTNACAPCSRNRNHNFTENVSWFRGSHSMKMGFYAAYLIDSQQQQNANLFGNTEYSNRFSGHPYADFLLGVPSTMQRAYPAVLRDNRRWDYSFYFTDEWKLSPKLTLTMGLRWDIHTPWTEASGLMAIFDPARGQLVVPDGSIDKVSSLLPQSYISVVSASSAGRPQSLVATDWNNLAPRLGFAWRPLGNTTVIRGGIGFYYDTAPWQPTSAAAPFVLNEPAFTNPENAPLVLPTVFPTGAGGPSSFTLPDGIRSDLRVPYSMQYTMTVEHQRWNTGFRLGYIGTNTRQGIYRYNLNQPIADSRLFIDKPRMFPQYPDILYADNGAGHQYHGLTFEVERRMRGGLHFQTYFVYARDIGDLERGQSPEDTYDRRRERAVWERFGPRRLSGNVIYELPYGKGRHWGNQSHWLTNGIFGGWNISGIFALEAGRFLTPLYNGPDPTGTRFTTSGSRPIVLLRPDQLRNPNPDNPTPEQWFDPSAFAPAPIGRFGSSAKGVIIGAPVQVLHASVAKYFYLGERARLRVEMLATNVTNTPNYQDPNLRIDQVGGAGRITAVIDRNTKFDSAIPRELQAQIRLEW